MLPEGPRTAVAISLIRHERLDTTLIHLREMENEGQVRSVTDLVGVMRWELVPLENGGVVEGTPQVFMDNGYVLTPSQMERLGL